MTFYCWLLFFLKMTWGLPKGPPKSYQNLMGLFYKEKEADKELSFIGI